MKIEKPKNSNYCATVVKVGEKTKLQGCDNIVATNFFGFQAIIGKNTKKDSLGIVLPAETRLSHKFCYENNLYRHEDLNKDKKIKGYIEDNRRIRAIKFRGHRSDCFFMPLESLNWTGANISKLNLGDEFDFLNKEKICEKHTVKVRGTRSGSKVDKAFKRVTTKFLPEHYDTLQYLKFVDSIPDNKEVIITQKLHGCSHRSGHTIVKRKINIIEKLMKLVGFKIQETEYDYVYGSRKVIKDINSPYQNHFYEYDMWSEEGAKIAEAIPKNFILYGELIGWTKNGAPIQANYTYEIEQGKSELYIYRIAQINPQGMLTDLSWDQVKEFCTLRNIKHVPEIWRGKKKNLKLEKYIDTRLNDKYRNCLPLAENLVDEGICVRVDKLVPDIYKYKSPAFLQHETKLLDKGIEDIEESQK